MKNPIPRSARQPAKIGGYVGSTVMACYAAYQTFDSPTMQVFAIFAGALSVVAGAAFIWATRKGSSRSGGR